MQFHHSDEIVVRFMESTLALEHAADAARELLNRMKDRNSPLTDLVATSLNDAISDLRICRRNFRYGHDCVISKCDSDSHK